MQMKKTGNTDGSMPENLELLVIRERLDTIRINLDILTEFIRIGGIPESDARWNEICRLDRLNLARFQEFSLSELPRLLQSKEAVDRKILQSGYFDWIKRITPDIDKLERLTKHFLSDLVAGPINPQNPGPLKEVRDTRFWQFLEQEELRSPHFSNSGRIRESEHSFDTEKSKREDQR
jgi:hypothetical protein